MAAGTYPLEWEADVLLRDGHPVHVRPITPDDGPALRRFHAALSARTVYFRFFAAKPQLTDRDVEYFTSVDHVSRVAFVALDRDEIVGVGRFDDIGEGSAEVAFVIRDDVQGLGLGSILLEHLAAAARERGVRRFVAEVLPENGRMLATFREAGYVVDQHREDDVIAVSFGVEPTEEGLAVMVAREHRAEARSVRRLLQPESVAVVGASRRPGGLGHQVLRHIIDDGFTGEVVAVHREVDQIAGVRCVRSLSEVGHVVDLAVVVVPADEVPSVIADAGAAGVHGLVVVSGGFGDAGPGGLPRQAALVANAHATGMRVVGPNALGLMNTDPQVRLNASLVPHLPRAGRVGFFCQSGALGSAILDRLADRGVGLSTFVSAGNRADVSGNDLLQYWRDDPGTDLVLLYLESIGNARKFARLVHGLAPAKPVIMVRTGGAGVAPPLGHAVASTALTQRAVEQVLADCGLVIVDSIDDLIDVGRVAAHQPLPTGRGVAVVGNSDALAVMAANAMADAALHAGGPVTFDRQAPASAYAQAVHDAMADPGVGSVLVIHVPPVERATQDDVRAALRRCPVCGERHSKPVVAVMPRGERTPAPDDVPVFADVEDAVRALRAVTWLAGWRADDAARASARAGIEVVSVTLPPPGLVAGDAAAHLLAEASGLRPALDDDTAGSMGMRITLVDDPLFGPVVSVGVDDPVAEALGDSSHRLAPVSVEGARAMLEALGAYPVLLGSGQDVGGLAAAIAAVSGLYLSVPGIVGADLRHVTADPVAGLGVGAAFVTVAEDVAVADPLTRRL